MDSRILALINQAYRDQGINPGGMAPAQEEQFQIPFQLSSDDRPQTTTMRMGETGPAGTPMPGMMAAPSLPPSMASPPQADPLQDKINSMKSRLLSGAPNSGDPINISENNFVSGQSPQFKASSQEPQWLTSLINGAIGQESPQRYDYSAPMKNVPDMARYDDSRDYSNNDQIVIEDSTGPNTAGTNRTVVQARERPSYEGEMAAYKGGQAFRQFPKEIEDLVSSAMGKSGMFGGGQQAAPRPAPSSVISQGMQLIDDRATKRAALEKDKSEAGGWFGFGKDDAIKRLEADAAPGFSDIEQKLNMLQSQYPTLLSKNHGAENTVSRDVILNRIKQRSPNIDSRLADTIADSVFNELNG